MTKDSTVIKIMFLRNLKGRGDILFGTSDVFYRRIRKTMDRARAVNFESVDVALSTITFVVDKIVLRISFIKLIHI